MPEDDRPPVAELALRRGFFFPASEAYGAVAGFWTYGPAGAAIKRNVEERWRERYVHAEGNFEIDSPTVMPEAVFAASGHLSHFTDMLVDCPECETAHRADHLVEAASDIEDAERLDPAEVADHIADLAITCPTCGTSLAGVEVRNFNLMFETAIGPGGDETGYLRPETAQGMFVDFPRLAAYARGRLPFGVAQVGRAYRNEISPRRTIIRVREMTQAEVEVFYDPKTDEPHLDSVATESVRLYPVDAQRTDGAYRETTLGDAVDVGIIENPWLAYYLGVAVRWFETIGIDRDRLRIRQHLPGERAHYAIDTWDLEAAVMDDWIEIGAVSYRGTYDLSKHDQEADDDFTIFRPYDEPRTVERATVEPDMASLGPAYGGIATAIAEALEELAQEDPTAFDGDTVSVEVDGDTYDIDTDDTGFTVETVTESGEHIVPHVIEPTLGIDRTVYTLLEHAYREDEVDGEERTYLALDARVAPTLAGVFPLMTTDGLDDRAVELARELSTAGLAVRYDESGNIGRRYRRQDEIGTPYCVTVDHETLEDDTVTIRDRDSTAQVRLDATELVQILVDLRDGRLAFDALVARGDRVDRGAVE